MATDVYKRGLVLAAMVTNAANITTGNGYNSSVGSIKRYPKRPDPNILSVDYAASGSTPMLIITDGETETREQETGSQIICEMHPVLYGIIAADASTASAALNNWIGDIEKYVEAYRGSWTASVIDTRTDSITILDDLELPQSGFEMGLTLTLSRAADAP